MRLWHHTTAVRAFRITLKSILHHASIRSKTINSLFCFIESRWLQTEMWHEFRFLLIIWSFRMQTGTRNDSELVSFGTLVIYSASHFTNWSRWYATIGWSYVTGFHLSMCIALNNDASSLCRWHFVLAWMKQHSFRAMRSNCSHHRSRPVWRCRYNNI